MNLQESLSRVVRRHDELRDTLGRPDLAPTDLAKFAKEYAELEPVVDQIRAVEQAKADMAEAEEILDQADGDPDLRSLADQELHDVRARLPEMERALQVMLLPRDEADARNAILEIRAGTGGDEAALFAADLLAMYQRYAAAHGWRMDVMEANETAIGGVKEAIAEINGVNVFARLKFESGVHRVQRVPETEAGGRIHTSAATVAVLPEAEDVDIEIDEKDLRVDVFRASGAGGQHVNRTESAVRITHFAVRRGRLSAGRKVAA